MILFWKMRTRTMSGMVTVTAAAMISPKGSWRDISPVNRAIETGMVRALGSMVVKVKANRYSLTAAMKARRPVVTSAGKSRAAQIGLQFGDDVLCIFTNDPVLADLEVIKVDLVDPVVLDGEGATALIEYELTVTNHGPDPAYDVVVEDVLPESLTFVSVSSSDGPCAHSDGVIHCALGTMAVGDVVIISVVVATEPLGEVTEPEPVNVVEVRSSTQDPNPTNNRDQEVTHIEEILPVEVLPFTGLHGERLAGVGLLLLGLGTGLVMVTIRRKRPYKGLHQA